jgi:hypothetical protein
MVIYLIATQEMPFDSGPALGYSKSNQHIDPRAVINQRGILNESLI